MKECYCLTILRTGRVQGRAKCNNSTFRAPTHVSLAADRARRARVRAQPYHGTHSLGRGIADTLRTQMLQAVRNEYGVSAVSDLNDLDESDFDSAGIKKLDKKKLTKALEK